MRRKLEASWILFFWVGALIVGLVFDWPILYGFVSFMFVIVAARVLYRKIKLGLSWRATFVGEAK